MSSSQTNRLHDGQAAAPRVRYAKAQALARAFVCFLLCQQSRHVQGLAIAPQPFQTVEFPGLGVEYMYHQTAIVQQDPNAASVALPMQGLLPRHGLQLLLHRIAQRVDLGVAGAGADDEDMRRGWKMGRSSL